MQWWSRSPPLCVRYADERIRWPAFSTDFLFSFFLLQQWAVEVDPSTVFNWRLLVRNRKSIGPLDGVVNHYGSKKECVQGLRAFRASVCQVVMRHLRIGLPNLAAAMTSRPKEDWADKDFKKRSSEFLSKSGSQFKQAYKMMQAMRAVRNHGKPTPTDSDELSKFCINVCANSTDLGWSEAGSSVTKDQKNAVWLCERFYTMIPKKGAAWKWLISPDVYTSMREDFGGLFSLQQGVPFAYADGMTARPDQPYVSVSANATASGSGSAANVHVLLSESGSIQANMKAKMLQFRDLLDEIAGIPGQGGALYLPGPVYHASQPLLQVCLLLVPSRILIADFPTFQS